MKTFVDFDRDDRLFDLGITLSIIVVVFAMFVSVTGCHREEGAVVAIPDLAQPTIPTHVFFPNLAPGVCPDCPPDAASVQADLALATPDLMESPDPISAPLDLAQGGDDCHHSKCDE